MKQRPPIDAVAAAAILVAAWAACVLVGWSLSLAGWLTSMGYVVAIAIGALAAVVAWRKSGGWSLQWRWRRYSHGWPAAFLALAFAVMLGGAYYEPSNIDALTYRLPRVMHWLDAGRWHWIETQHLRMNYSAAGAEWMLAPLLALGVPTRLFFLSNALAFLVLPGLMFVWLRGLGASQRAAWRWMWITPAALVFALQAGSLANDLLGAVAFLASMVFARRASTTGPARWFILGVVALGLTSGVKASNLALVPMGLVSLWPAWRRLSSRRARTGVVALALGVAVSAVPTLVLNLIHSGHWSGDPTNLTGVRPGSPAAALASNVVLVGVQNAAPPFFPWASTWNSWSEATLLPWWRARIGETAFPRFTLHVSELPQEEWAGLGLIFCALLLFGWWQSRGTRPMPHATRLTLWAGTAGAFVYALAMGSEMPARLLTPFYFVPLAAVAVRDTDAGQTVRWRSLALLAMAVAFAAVILTPARPLFPATHLWTLAQARWPDSRIVARAARVYEVYAQRPDMLGAIRRELRPDERTIGFLATDDDSEWSLARPGDGRRVVHVSGLRDPRGQTLSVVVVRGDAFWPDIATEEAALANAGFHVAARQEIVVKAARPPERWLVVRRKS